MAKSEPSQPIRHSDASRAITKGAKDCQDCGHPPLGMIQPRNVAGIGEIEIFEVGCVVCRDHRAIAATREEAVRKWNAREFLAPRLVDDNADIVTAEATK